MTGSSTRPRSSARAPISTRRPSRAPRRHSRAWVPASWRRCRRSARPGQASALPTRHQSRNRCTPRSRRRATPPPTSRRASRAPQATCARTRRNCRA
ncbi:hypothetical protein ACFPRL_14780 [Pseudoclavibacter helvolus]